MKPYAELTPEEKKAFLCTCADMAPMIMATLKIAYTLYVAYLETTTQGLKNDPDDNSDDKAKPQSAD